MARKASPWFWAERNGWFVTLQGQRHFLGEHPEDTPTPKKSKRTGQWNTPESIGLAFRKLVTGGGTQGPADDEAVVNVLDDFIAWCYENRAKRTADRYKDFCLDFVKKYGRLSVFLLSSKQVTEWLAGHPTWNSTSKRNAITALQRGFNWAVRNRGWRSNPIKGMEKPEAKRRTEIVSPADFEQLLGCIHDQPFHDLLVVSYDSGARPQEVKNLEVRHIQIDKQRAVIPGEEAKGGITRVIYFPTDRSMEIIRRLMQERAGYLFLNNKNRPWTGFSVKNRFEDVQIATGIAEMNRRGIESSVTGQAVEKFMKTLKPTRKERGTGKEVAKKEYEMRREAKQKLVAEEAKQYAPRVFQYALRHSFVTRKLVAGVDSHIVAALAGHRDTGMVDRVYSHVADDHEFMLKAAARDITPATDASASSGE